MQTYFHGSKQHSLYRQRYQILIENRFDPLSDLRRDWQGIYQLSGDKPALRDAIRAILRETNRVEEETPPPHTNSSRGSIFRRFAAEGAVRKSRNGFMARKRWTTSVKSAGVVATSGASSTYRMKYLKRRRPAAG